MPFLRVRDVRLHYELEGPETDAGRAPLVLLHGLGSSTRDWRPQVEHFSQKRRVLALDLRGHGRSEAPPGPYAIPLFAGDTADAVRRLLPRATASGGVHVTGLSMGGMVALQLALDAPSVPKSLTVVNAGVDYRPATRRQRRLLWQRRAAMRALSVRQVGWLLGRRLFPGRPALQQKMTDRWAQNDPVAYRASFEAIMGWSARARLPEITAPSLVVAADGDYLPLSVYRTYAGRIPHAELAVLENARHAVPVAQPEAFNAVLEDFLDGF